MSGVLVYSERKPLAFELLSGGREIAASLGSTLAVALLGPGTADHVEAYFTHGAEKAYVVEDSALEEHHTSVYAEALVQIVQKTDTDLVLIGSTRRGRTLAPRLAQKLGAGCVTDALHLSMQDQGLVSQRHSLGGNTIKEVVVTSPTVVIAVLPGTFEPSPDRAGSPATSADAVEKIAIDLTPSRAKIVDRRKKVGGAVNIEEAERVVCVGRGVENKNDLEFISSLVNALGGELAGTRPLAYEYGWITEDRMIGISGKTVRPQLYVAVGLSGQIQHSVSIRDSKIILAINKDKSAPIFEMADYGIVGDLYEIVPRLTKALLEIK
ncbi:MAG: electron transfer flavoprotein subunit alpha/FixB family protein [Anaerolineales bacterium]|nr:electron transfer flavoprotein subunit alpha/FixB family protein [Anaerolineales bacterium]